MGLLARRSRSAASCGSAAVRGSRPSRVWSRVARIAAIPGGIPALIVGALPIHAIFLAVELVLLSLGDMPAVSSGIALFLSFDPSVFAIELLRLLLADLAVGSGGIVFIGLVPVSAENLRAPRVLLSKIPFAILSQRNARHKRATDNNASLQNKTHHLNVIHAN